MNELALFAGAGGGILGGKLLGWNPVGAVEIEDYPRRVLLQRQKDGALPYFPIWDDVRSFDGRPWRGLVDVVSGGFPCQDISVAGKGVGIEGSRSGLWAEMHRIICEIRPRFAFLENSPLLVSRGLYRVLGDLASSGYDAAWLVLGASDVGAPHKRERIWILAEDREEQHADEERDLADPCCDGRSQSKIHASVSGKTVCEAPQREPERANGFSTDFSDGSFSWIGRRQESPRDAGENSSARCSRHAWWLSEPNVGRVADGVASKMDRLRAIGNGQVPLVAATAFRILKNLLQNNNK